VVDSLQNDLEKAFRKRCKGKKRNEPENNVIKTCHFFFRNIQKANSESVAKYCSICLKNKKQEKSCL
jgi:hypothetical protein